MGRARARRNAVALFRGCRCDADARYALERRQRASLRNLDVLSLAPHQELQSFAERLILPCGLILLSFLQNFGGSSAHRRDVTATGQFMMVRRDAYHAAVVMPRYAAQSAKIWNCPAFKTSRIFRSAHWR